MALGGHFEFCQKRMFRSGDFLGLFTDNKKGHYEHFLKFSALYIFFHLKT